MTPERTTEGLEASLRPRGVGRLFSAAFLGVWLLGWIAGESFALWILIRGALALLSGKSLFPGSSEPLEPAPALLAGLFLLVWLAFWTLGGYMAARELLRVIWSEDRIVARHDALVVHRRLGPFRWTTTIPRPTLLRIYGIERKCRLLAETSEGQVELTSLAGGAECETLAMMLREELGLSEGGSKAAALPPERWREVVDAEGGIALVEDESQRRTRGRVAWAMTVIFACVALPLAAYSMVHPDMLPLAGGLGAVTIARLVLVASGSHAPRMETRSGTSPATAECAGESPTRWMIRPCRAGSAPGSPRAPASLSTTAPPPSTRTRSWPRSSPVWRPAGASAAGWRGTSREHDGRGAKFPDHPALRF